QYLSWGDLSDLDRSFIHELVYGVLRQKGHLDFVLDFFSKRGLDGLGLWTGNIIRLGAYQILYMDKTPPSAAVNESVELAKRYGGKHGFVNAILRSLERGRDKIVYPEINAHPIHHISAIYSYPEWMVQRWVKRYGVERTIGLCQWNNEIPPFTIRTNRIFINRDDLLQSLKEEGVTSEPCAISPDGLILFPAARAKETSAFKKGWFYIQDEASQIVSVAAGPMPGEVILDACAAPGGKTTHLAQIMENKGEIVALDIKEDRLSLLNENIQRLGINIVKAYLLDASGDFGPLKDKRFDRIIIDAPCSGLGVLRRNPDAKWRKDEELIFMYQDLQVRLLENLSKLIKDQGTLVYSTCSTEEEENEMVIDSFIDNHPEYKVEDLRSYLPQAAFPLIDNRGFLNTIFNPYRMDGFFVARLRKNG
ncbi:MAG: 16S rRNA (cytosine(967)-C(5))-methyltransferase RsmB, partial [Nitrospirota bacterium]